MWAASRAASESLDFADQWLPVDGWLSALQRPPIPRTLPILLGSLEKRSQMQISTPTIAFHFQNTLFFYKAASHCGRTHTHTHTPVHTNTPDKLMNSARGGVLDHSGSCLTAVWGRLTKTTETSKTKRRKEDLRGTRSSTRQKQTSEEKRGEKLRTKGKKMMPVFFKGGFGGLSAEASELRLWLWASMCWQNKACDFDCTCRFIVLSELRMCTFWFKCVLKRTRAIQRCAEMCHSDKPSPAWLKTHMLHAFVNISWGPLERSNYRF